MKKGSNNKKKNQKNRSKMIQKNNNQRKQDIIIHNFMIIYFIVAMCVGIILILLILKIKNNNIECKKCEGEQFSLTQESPNYVFLGDSLTANYNLFEAFPEIPLVNSGNGGDRTDDILNNMYDRVYRYNPSDVILQIGTNDVNDQEKQNDEIYHNTIKIIEEIKRVCPNANIYVESIYPSRESWGITDNNSDRQKVNELVQQYCEEHNITYIDMYNALKEESSNKIKEEYVVDGLHLSDKGYEVVTETLRKYLNLLEVKNEQK